MRRGALFRETLKLTEHIINTHIVGILGGGPRSMATRSQALKKERTAEKRLHPRFTAQFRSTFSGGQREGQGKTLDLSDGGCRIETDQPVVVGASFECRIYAHGLSWPLRIEEAQVRWVKGKTFGLQFVTMRPDERMKLRQVLTTLKASSK